MYKSGLAPRPLCSPRPLAPSQPQPKPKETLIRCREKHYHPAGYHEEA